MVLMMAGVVSAKPLTFITLTGQGSLADTAIRQSALAIERHTGRQVLVVNMPGGSGLVGLRHFASLPPDSDTILVGNASISYHKHLGNFDSELTPLVGLAEADLAVFVSASGEFQTLSDLKKTPNKLLAGSTSPMVELSIHLVDEQHGTKSEVVNYKQFSQAVIDLSQGRINYLPAPKGAQVINAMLDAGRIKEIHNLGPLFTWVALFARPVDKSNKELAPKLIEAVKETKFTAPVRVYMASPEQVVARQKSELAVMRKKLGLSPPQ